jgi:hypothetical protein
MKEPDKYARIREFMDPEPDPNDPATIARMRAMTPAEKIQLMGEMQRRTRERHAAWYRATHADAQDGDIWMDWIDRLGMTALYKQIRETQPQPDSDEPVIVVMRPGES